MIKFKDGPKTSRDIDFYVQATLPDHIECPKIYALMKKHQEYASHANGPQKAMLHWDLVAGPLDFTQRAKKTRTVIVIMDIQNQYKRWPQLANKAMHYISVAQVTS